jgi:hypothetical protein
MHQPAADIRASQQDGCTLSGFASYPGTIRGEGVGLAQGLGRGEAAMDS